MLLCLIGERYLPGTNIEAFTLTLPLSNYNKFNFSQRLS